MEVQTHIVVCHLEIHAGFGGVAAVVGRHACCNGGGLGESSAATVRSEKRREKHSSLECRFIQSSCCSVQLRRSPVLHLDVLQFRCPPTHRRGELRPQQQQQHSAQRAVSASE